MTQGSALKLHARFDRDVIHHEQTRLDNTMRLTCAWTLALTVPVLA